MHRRLPALRKFLKLARYSSTKTTFLLPYKEYQEFWKHDLHSYSDSLLKSAVKKILFPVYMKAFRVKATYEKLAKINSEYLEDTFVTLHRDRTPAPLLNMNYVTILEDDLLHNTMFERASSLIIACLNFHKNCTKITEADGVLWTTAEQCKHFLGRSFTPAQGKNLIVDFPDSNHITVMVLNKVYKLQVIQDGKIIHAGELVSMLKTIVQHAKKNYNPKEIGIGYLSAAARQRCLQLRETLSPENKETIDALTTGLLNVALEVDEKPETLEETAKSTFSKHFTRRWYEKGVQLVVHGNAKAGFIWSFSSYLDGATAAYCSNKVYEMARDVCIFSKNVDYKPVELPFKLEPNVVQEAQKFSKMMLQDQQNVYYLDTGKEFFKKKGVSPDSCIQIALILATYRTFGKIPNLGHIVMNKHKGTLERPPAVTKEIEEFIHVMQEKSSDKEKKSQVFKKALESHKNKILHSALHGSPLALSLASSYTMNLPMWYVEKMSKFFTAVGFDKYIYVGKKPDIITSSVRLGKHVQLLGRPGIYFYGTNLFSLHLAVKEDKTQLIFIPSPQCDNAKMFTAFQKALDEVKELL